MSLVLLEQLAHQEQMELLVQLVPQEKLGPMELLVLLEQLDLRVPQEQQDPKGWLDFLLLDRLGRKEN